MAKNNDTAVKAGVKAKITYSKSKILNSKRYEHRVDLLGVLLDDSEAYTFDEVDALVEKFMKGKVK